jgi:hypothetical protein
MINYQELKNEAILSRAKTEHFQTFLKKMKISLVVEGDSFLISHDGAEYEMIDRDPKQIGFVVEED